MPSVLIVDDSPIDRVLLEGVLRKDPRMRIRLAKSGVEALTAVSESAPDVVVTDLQMPELDGLQLVTALAIHYPRIPVILITAYGSETLAVQALEQGAASYVPKSQVAAKLRDAVEHVLTLAHADRGYEQLGAGMELAEFRFSLENDFQATDHVVELVRQLVTSMGICDAGTQVRVGMALEEAVRAAMLRGNLELTQGEILEHTGRDDASVAWLAQRRQQPQFRGRRLRLHVKLELHTAVITVSHEGSPLTLGSAAVPTLSAALEAPDDRSIILMRAFMDEVSFSADGRGITLLKRRPTNNSD